MSLNCSSVDSIVDAFLSFNKENADAFLNDVIPISSVVASCILVAVGHYVIRTMASGIASFAVALLIFQSTRDFDCVPRLGLVGAGVVCAILLVLCLLKAGLFIIGGAAFGTVSHFIFDAIPYDWTRAGLPFFQGRSVIYWITVGASSLLGACIVYRGRRKTLILTTSILGGVGFSYGLATLIDSPTSPWVWVGVSTLTSIIGVFTQTQLRAYQTRQKRIKDRDKKKKSRKREDEESEAV